MPIWLAGIIGGLIAGGVMIGGIMTLAPFRGFGGVLTPPQLVAGTLQGETAVNGGPASAAIGLALHMLIAAILGFAFAVMMAGLGLTDFTANVRFAAVPGSGIVYGMCAFGVTEYAVLPFVDRPMFKHLPPLDWALMHVLYGAVLGWFVALMA